jgi:catechol 2,3-dioxygenase
MVELGPERLPADSRIGAVHLTVRDLERSAAFYTDRLGLRARALDGALGLGVGDEDLLVLVENRNARPARGVTGLYHFALLVPSRRELALVLRRLAATSTPLEGASDHGVSEALYLADPDQIGIEIYRDRPRAEWPREAGQLAMGTEPLDTAALLREGDGAGDPRAPLARGTTMGHVHLHVAELDEAERFYVGTMGFERMQRYGPSALFVSAGGYHHHVGLNTWQGVGAPPPPPDSTGLRHFELLLPDGDARTALAERLRRTGVAVTQREGALFVQDPSHNGIVIPPRR